MALNAHVEVHCGCAFHMRLVYGTHNYSMRDGNTIKALLFHFSEGVGVGEMSFIFSPFSS